MSSPSVRLDIGLPVWMCAYPFGLAVCLPVHQSVSTAVPVCLCVSTAVSVRRGLDDSVSSAVSGLVAERWM